MVVVYLSSLFHATSTHMKHINKVMVESIIVALSFPLTITLYILHRDERNVGVFGDFFAVKLLLSNPLPNELL
mgnify:CR=1 FL=1